jgi:Ca2+-binding RTX toxin-like protein
MTQFVFDQIPSGRLVPIQGTDTVLFHGGSASAASVTFALVLGDPSAINVSFGGHTVQFNGGVINAASNGNMIFDDGSHLLIGSPNNEAYTTAGGNDALFGGGGDDTLDGGAGDNLIQGNQGDDVLLAGVGADTIFGGQGDDTIITGIDLVAVVNQGDFAQGNLGNDTIHGGGGSDTLLGGQGNDSIAGGHGDDWISGDRGNDTVSGGAGGDAFFIASNGDDDRVLDFNGAEGDRVHVPAGTVLELHQTGADTLILVDHGSSTMTLVGVQASTLDLGWFVTDGPGVSNGGETIIGSEATDVLIGDRGADSIQGGGGGDWITGGLGDDTVLGGAGGDVFFATAHGGDDRVLDFNGAEGDRVRVEAGIAFDVEQDGNDTLILIDHGSSTMRLVGVQMSTLHADWIVGV